LLLRGIAFFANTSCSCRRQNPSPSSLSFDYTSPLFLSSSFHISESSGLSISGGLQAERSIMPGMDPVRYIFTKKASDKLLSLTADGQ
jgi:hypothetical protein